MRKRLITIFLPFLLVSCHFQNPQQILSEAELLMPESPDSALTLLREIDFPMELSEKNLAEYGRLQGLSHYLTGKSLAEDSLVLYSLQYYRTHQDSSKFVKTCDLAEEYYTWKKDYKKVLSVLDEGLLWSNGMNNNELISHFYFSKAYLFFTKLKDYTQALYNFEQSLLFEKAAVSYYLDALCRNRLGKDSIDYYMEKSVEFALLKQDTLLACHCLRNYAQVLSDKGKLNEAVKQIQRSYELLDYYRNFSMNNIVMSEVQLKSGNIDSAQHYLNLAIENRYTRSFGISKEKDIALENMMVLLQNVIDYSRNRTLNYGDVGRFNDSIIVDIREQYKLLEGKKEANQNLEKQNLKLTIVKQQTQIWLILVVLVLVLSSGFIYLYIRKKRQRIIEAEDRIETMTRLLDDASQTSSNNNSDSYFFKKILLQQLGVIRLVATTPTSQNQELLKQMARITNEEIPVDSLLSWEDLYPVIDSIYEGFYSNMLRLYNDLLIEKEIQLCCLLCAGFSTKEICVVTQQSIPTIYQRKTTIRKKLKMGEKEEIIPFIRQQFEADL